MKKRTLSFILALIMCLSLLPMTALAAGDPFKERFFPSGTPTALGTSYIDVDNTGSSYVKGYLPIPDDLNAFFVYDDTTEDWKAQLGIYSWTVWFQSDVAVDSPTAWLSTAAWNTPEDGVDNAGYAEAAQVWSSHTTNKVEEASLFDLYWEPAREQLAGATVSETGGDGDPIVRLDTANHTFYFRQRYIVSYEYENDYGNWHYLTAPWSATVSVGKNGTQQPLVKPTKLDAPVISELVVRTPDVYGGTQASIQYDISFPESIGSAWRWYQINGDSYGTGYLEAQINVDNKGWKDIYTANDEWLFDGERSTTSDEAITQSSHVQLRVRLSGGEFTSPWSNVLQVNAPDWTAAEWAMGYVQSAEEYGILPDCLASADLTQRITRAEFAALSVKLYESLMGKPVEAGENFFTDTADPEIVKAYTVGITNGKGGSKETGDLKFMPAMNVTRQEAATMLTRTYKAATMDGWTLDTDSSFKLTYTMPTKFNDDVRIAKWAYDSVYFMAPNKIIEGSGGLFRPEALPTGGDSVNYGLATRQEAVKIAVVTYENLGK